MPVPTEVNAALRDRVRLGFLVPVPLDRAEEPTIEDLTPEQLAELDKLRLFNSRFLSAVRGGSPAAIDETRPRFPTGGPRGTGRLLHFIGDNLAGGIANNLSWGPVGFPYIIREIQLSGQQSAVAPSLGSVRVNLHVTSADRTSDGTIPDEPKIWPELVAGDAIADVLEVAGPTSNSIRYQAGVLVLDSGQFLTARYQASVGGLVFNIGITIEELSGFGGGGAILSFPTGRSSMNVNTRLPAPRSTTPPTPRGAIIRVTHGSRILAERRISWPALDPSIRAKWFNQQVGEPPDPSVEWIR